MADQRVAGNKLSLFLIIFTISQTTAEFGLLNVRNSNDPNVLPKDYCLTYNPLYQDLPKTIEESKYYSYLSLLPDFLCHEPESPERLADKIVVVMRGNCTFTEKATLVQASNGNAVVVASKDALVTPHGNESAGDYDNINIPVALIRYDDAEEIQGKGDGIVAALYAPAETTRVDYNLILIWLIAVGTVVIGAYWSGLTAHRIDKKRMLRRKRGDAESAKDEEDEDEAQSIDVSAVMVIIFVVMIVSMLLLLYFFYDYIVYVIILFFCVAAAAGIHACLLPFIRMIPLGSYKLPPRDPICGFQSEVRSIVLGLLSIGLCVVWFVFRHEDWAWMLQDAMGITFSINLLKTIRLPNFKICFILLCVLFLYDIFFVFITPYFTKSGESVMVQVATGGGGAKEQIPIVVKVPRFSNSPYKICEGVQYSLLGFGDILVPGMLVAYACRFDFKVRARKIYFVATSVAYGVGLVICFVALLFMQTGQPALLYLVPCTVLTTLVIAWARHEVKHLWNGHRGGVRRPQNTSDEKDESVDSDSENPPNTIQQQTDVRLDSSSESLLVSEDKKETQPLVKDD